jgi:hypothetical protein
MTIAHLQAQPNWTLSIVTNDGRHGIFDVTPYLADEAFEELQNPEAFKQVHNGKYFVEWECGADLSADTIEARWQLL